MGLTVHFKFEFRGSKKEAKAKLEELESYVIQLGKEIEEDFEPELREINFRKLGPMSTWIEKLEERWGWACTQYKDIGFEEIGDKILSGPNSEDGFILSLLMLPGCEPMNIGLFRHEGRDRDLWQGNAFTKTQYAKDFLKAHLSVIAILDRCKEIGILKKVDDEGSYWDTRDLKVLGEEITESTKSLLGLSKVLKELVEKHGGELEMQIDKQANILEVKEKMEEK